MDILNEYLLGKPVPQNIVDLFKGEWSSKLPPVNGVEIVSGNAELFNDNRIKLLNEYFPLDGKTVLELGPLEAGHTYMVHEMKASSILAIESNSRSFLKCLLVKELYDLKNTQFLLGDAQEYMKDSKDRFDLCMASGILYHSLTPHLFIEECCKKSDHVFMWTHYYDPEKMSAYPALAGKFSKEHSFQYRDLAVKAWQFDYLTSLEWSGFCGGSAPYSLWISREDIFTLFKMNGFDKIHVFFEDPTHPLGPNICLMASKTQ